MRTPKSFTIEMDITEYVDETKGNRSASDRVNELLRRAILQEQQDRLAEEASEFFAESQVSRSETKALQEKSLRTFSRD